MRAWWSALVWLAGGEGTAPVLEFQSVAVESGYELRISGRGWAEGAVVEIRFRRMVNRLEGPGRSLVTVPEEASWVRRVVVRQGAFAHREVFPLPGRVEVEVSLDPMDQRGKVARAEAESVSGVYHVASPWETALALQREGRGWEETLLEAGRLEAAAGRGRAARRLAALRREEGRVLFSATTALMKTVLEEFLNSASEGRGKSGPHPGALSLSLPDLPLAFHRVRDCFERERRVLIAEVAGRLGGVDPVSARRTLETLRRSAFNDEALLKFLKEVEDDLGWGGSSRGVQRTVSFSDRARRGD